MKLATSLPTVTLTLPAATITIIIMLLAGTTSNSRLFAAAADEYRCSLSTYEDDPVFRKCLFGYAYFLGGAVGRETDLQCPDDTNAKFYGRAYCKDESLGDGECIQCQRDLVPYMDEYCVKAYGAAYFNDKCEIRFETYRFY